MMLGPNIQMLKHVSKLSSHPIVASGGIRNKDDVLAVGSIANISSCIVGKAILNDLTTLKTLLVQ